MKRILLILCMLISIPLAAQTLSFRTTAYAQNEYNYYTQTWSGWSDWVSSDMLLTINLNSDIVIIYSPVKQTYRIYDSVENYYDSDGDLNVIFKFIDQDGDRGNMRFLQRATGSSEIYIEFSNVRWCYTVERI